MNNDQILLVDESDQQVGISNKLQAHKAGLLHRAFSIFLCRFHNNRWETLLQQRHPQKYHSANLWSNSCCSHPMPEESTLQAAHRRLRQELNLTADLKHIGHIIYRAEFSNQMIEHEYDHIFIGINSPQEVHFNIEEINAIKWIGIDELHQQLISNPTNFTAWLLPTLQKVRFFLDNHSLSVGKQHI